MYAEASKWAPHMTWRELTLTLSLTAVDPAAYTTLGTHFSKCDLIFFSTVMLEVTEH